MTTTEQPTTYRVTFGRIGSRHNVQSMVVQARDVLDLVQQIHAYVKPRLGAREVEVSADLLERRGSIRVGGFRAAGRFTIEHVDESADQVDAPR